MNNLPDTNELRAFLAAGRLRRSWLRAATGAAAGLVVAVVSILLGWVPSSSRAAPVVVAVCSTLVAMFIGTLLARRRDQTISRAIESRAPECRNLLITAEELLEQSTRSDPAAGARAGDYLTTLVFRDATRLSASIRLPALFPARRVLIVLALSTLALALLAIRGASVMASFPIGSSGSASVDDITFTITPPSYTGEKATQSHNPARIEALAGSRVQMTVKAHAGTVTIETLASKQVLTSSTAGVFAGDMTVDSDGYLALEPLLADGHAGTRRLIGLSVTNDDPPRVRITKPGHDIRMLDGNQTLDINVESDDDIGMATLQLRYTKVSGSGEQFTFVEGEVPLTIDRSSARAWKATAHWRLNPLALAAGDVVVYRAVATDHRPGALAVESDAFIAEVIAPGGEAAGGFNVDTDMERYALSEQMVILKSERLLASKPKLAVDSFADASADLSAEQRSVRAEFVFMMGGEIAAAPTSMTMLDEEGEAAGEGDLAAGYSRNQGRDALLSAIRSMSRASGSLTEADVTTALVREKAALSQLEKAFSHSRILLRALTEHERLDLTRRLTGTLLDAARDSHPNITPEPVPLVNGLRQALAGLATLAGTNTLAPDAAPRATALAESVLRIDPASVPLQQVSVLLTEAATAMSQSGSAQAHTLLDRAATALAEALRARLLSAPASGPAFESNRLNGALTDALRQPGSGG